jgi:hypothetical protein
MTGRGILVKEYKGFNIMVSNFGVFFCNTRDKSLYYEDRTYASDKITDIYDHLSSYKKLSKGDKAYNITIDGITTLTVESIKRNGVILFTDKTSSKDGSRKNIYSGSISQYKAFPHIAHLLNAICEHKRSIQDIEARIHTHKRVLVEYLESLPRPINHV